MAGVSVTISAVDKASASFDKINKRMAALMKPTKELQASMTRFASASGLSKIASNMDALSRNSYGAFQSISRIVTPLGAITSAASAAGMYRLVTQFGAFGTALRFNSQRIGIGADRLQALQGAAELAGSSAAGLTSGMTHLKDAMTDAIGGRNNDMLLYMRTLGINIGSLRTGARSVSSVLPELADKISKIADPTVRARVAAVAFGGAADDLMPLLMRGSKGIAAYIAEAQHFGVINDQGTKAAFNLAQTQTRVELAVMGMTNSISQSLAPVLSPLLNSLAEWIAKNRALVATRVADFVQRFSVYIGGINWHAAIEGVDGFAKRANDVVGSLGGWTRVSEVLFGLWAGSKALGMISSLMKIAGSVTTVLRLLSLIPGVRIAGFSVAAAAASDAAMRKAIANDRSIPRDQKAMAIASIEAGGVDIPTAPNDAGNLGDQGFNWIRRQLGLRPQQDQQARAREAFAYFRKQGWTPAQASGLVANIQAESGFDAGISGDHGKAFGLGQWHADRQAAFQTTFGKPIGGSSYEQQLAFIQYELTHGESAAGNALRGAGDAETAGGIVSRLYERPGDVEGEARNRGALAVDWNRRLASDATPVKVQVQLTHANQPPEGFKAKVQPSGSVATAMDYSSGF